MCRYTVTTYCEDFYSSQDDKGHAVVGALIGRSSTIQLLDII